MDERKKSEALVILKNKLGTKEANQAIANPNIIDLIASVPIRSLQVIGAEQLRKIYSMRASAARAYSEMVKEQITARQYDQKLERIDSFLEIADLEVDTELEEARLKSIEAKLRRENQTILKSLEMEMEVKRKKHELATLTAEIAQSKEALTSKYQKANEKEELELELEIAKLRAEIEKTKNSSKVPEARKRKTREERISEVTAAKYKYLQELISYGVSKDSAEYKRAEMRYDQILHNLQS